MILVISPDKVAFYASQKEDENYKFRSYLKVHADEEELDQQFQKLVPEPMTHLVLKAEIGNGKMSGQKWIRHQMI